MTTFLLRLLLFGIGTSSRHGKHSLRSKQSVYYWEFRLHWRSAPMAATGVSVSGRLYQYVTTWLSTHGVQPGSAECSFRPDCHYFLETSSSCSPTVNGNPLEDLIGKQNFAFEE